MESDPPARSPGRALGAIGELVEKILIDVPMKDVLVSAQRVCRKWRLTVQSSTKLQQKLFFVPVIEPKKSLHAIQKFHLTSVDSFPTTNITRRVDFFIPHELNYIDENILSEDELSFFRGLAKVPYGSALDWPVEVNPLAPKCEPMYDDPDGEYNAFEARSLNRWDSKAWHGINLQHWQSTEASWRRMLPFQPLPPSGIIDCVPRLDYWSDYPQPELEADLAEYRTTISFYAERATFGAMMDAHKTSLISLGLDLDWFQGIRFRGLCMLTPNEMLDPYWDRLRAACENSMAFKEHYKQLLTTVLGSQLVAGEITLGKYIEVTREERILETLPALKALFGEEDPTEEDPTES